MALDSNKALFKELNEETHRELIELIELKKEILCLDFDVDILSLRGDPSLP